MIVVIEPRRAPGFVSGGYRYQHEIMLRLAARGEGELRECGVGELDATVDSLRRKAPAAIVAVDGLFAELAGRALPDGVIALLHTTPTVRIGSCRVIVTSQRTAEALGDPVPSPSIWIVPPGLDDCFLRGDTRQRGERRRVVCVGTVSALKNQRLVAAALASLRDVPCELVLLGDVKSEPDEARAVTAAAQSVPVFFAGVVSPNRVSVELHRADLFVSASRSESFGMAVAEAAACGTPVLAFATGEIDTFIDDGENGWLVDTRTADRDFIARLHDVLRSPHLLDAAREGARRPSVWSWDVAASAFARACSSLAVQP